MVASRAAVLLVGARAVLVGAGAVLAAAAAAAATAAAAVTAAPARDATTVVARNGPKGTKAEPCDLNDYIQSKNLGISDI